MVLMSIYKLLNYNLLNILYIYIYNTMIAIQELLNNDIKDISKSYMNKRIARNIIQSTWKAYIIRKKFNFINTVEDWKLYKKKNV